MSCHQVLTGSLFAPSCGIRMYPLSVNFPPTTVYMSSGISMFVSTAGGEQNSHLEPTLCR